MQTRDWSDHDIWIRQNSILQEDQIFELRRSGEDQ